MKPDTTVSYFLHYATLPDLVLFLEWTADELRTRGVPDAPWQLGAAALSIMRREAELKARNSL